MTHWAHRTALRAKVVAFSLMTAVCSVATQAAAEVELSFYGGVQTAPHSIITDSVLGDARVRRLRCRSGIAVFGGGEGRLILGPPSSCRHSLQSWKSGLVARLVAQSVQARPSCATDGPSCAPDGPLVCGATKAAPAARTSTCRRMR